MKRVYVAGAYSADNVIDVLKNIGRGEHWASIVFMNGMAPFCPWHDKSYVFLNHAQDFTVDMFYKYSMAWLEVSDAVFLVPGWEGSSGTASEIVRANDLGIPVFKNLTDLLKWRDE